MTVELSRVEQRRAERRSRVTVVGVLGELLITGGVLVMAFLGWQLWLNNIISSNEQKSQAMEASEQWSMGDKGEAITAAPVDRTDPGAPQVDIAPGNAVQFANIIIPRFGADYTIPVRQGVGVKDVLAYGVGHYDGTQMPGDVGNVALAAHRTGWGEPFRKIVDLQVGDNIYIETEAGWYQYVYRSLEYVMPSGVEVIGAVPQMPDAAPTDRLLTLTSCNPVTTAAERIIAYAVYETWYPRAGGPPAEIAAVAQVAAAG
ncbi:MAG: class E sortase [Rhodoglobus sp.]